MRWQMGSVTCKYTRLSRLKKDSRGRSVVLAGPLSGEHGFRKEIRPPSFLTPSDLQAIAWFGEDQLQDGGSSGKQYFRAKPRASEETRMWVFLALFSGTFKYPNIMEITYEASYAVPPCHSMGWYRHYPLPSIPDSHHTICLGPLRAGGLPSRDNWLIDRVLLWCLLHLTLLQQCLQVHFPEDCGSVSLSTPPPFQ